VTQEASSALSSSTVSVNGNVATLFRASTETMPAIYLLRDGRFAAVIQERWQCRTSLVSLEKLVRSVIKPVRVFQAPSRWWGGIDRIEVREAVAVKDNRIVTSDGLSYKGDWYLLDDESLVQALQALKDEYDTALADLESRRVELMDKARRLRKNDFQPANQAAPAVPPAAPSPEP
jgi:hypothetical protein